MVDERRVKALNAAAVGEGPVVYVMAREQRVHDNWALLYAQERALASNVPLLVLFALGPAFNNATRRHNDWMVASLQDVVQTLVTKHIPFFIEMGEWDEEVVSFVKQRKVGEVIFDNNPLEPVRTWRENAARKLAVRTSVVDARNIVPVWEASDKTEFAAYTIRPKIHRKLKEFLSEFPVLKKHPYEYAGTVPAINWQKVRDFRTITIEAPLPKGWTPGERAAQKQLQQFIDTRLEGYASKRNDPTMAGVSDLSPYLRWGNISAQRVALTVQHAHAPKDDTEAFLEELIVRRELSDNFVYYTKHHDTLDGAHPWAQETLKQHWNDVREYTYSLSTFEAARTHDPLWNAAQRQMIEEGKMHGFMRMYWAKKILEWSATPSEAIKIALTLNDRYELDGRDSNGVVGVMWSIAGVHDRAWTERPVFGKIRYMNFNGCKRKFDVAAYINRYSETPSLL